MNEKKESADDYEKLRSAVLRYLSELDSPVSDISYRRALLNQLRKLTSTVQEETRAYFEKAARLRL